MTAAALFDTALALARRIRDATGLEVHIGSPLRREMGTARVALTLVHIQPNAALRNMPVFSAPRPSAPITAIPFDLHFLITCYRAPTLAGVAPADPSELTSLGQVIRALHADPLLTGSALPGQDVRLSPASYGPEDMSRTWGLFADEPFRTSIVYLASPVFIEAGETAITADPVPSVGGQPGPEGLDMTLGANIRFDSPPRTDRVTLAVAAVDAVTGALVRSGVSARIDGLTDRPIVKASGMLVFINLAEQPQYDVEVDGRRAGFPFVERFTFTPPAAGNRDPAARRRDVFLVPGPDYPFPPGTTLVRGVVTRGSAPVANASISASPAAGGASFKTRSVANGAFALALRLPPLGTYEAEAPVSVRIEVSEGGDERSLLRSLSNGRSQSFLEPIDLAGSNDPGLFAPE